LKPDTETDFELNVSPEFIAEGIKEAHRQYKKSGPYTKDEKIKRQNEVYRLHFEYGYSARRIAELMKVNRNTINSDIQYWYSKIVQKNESSDIDALIIDRIERLEIQRTRLREMLDKTDEFQQKITIEKMLFDIETKILQINVKIVNSTTRAHDLFVDYINKWMEEHKYDDRYVKFFDTIKVSDKASKRIKAIIDEDRKKAKQTEL
jgi:hypothetical protein